MARKRGWLIFFLFIGIFMFFGIMFIFGIITALDDRPVVRNNTILRFNLSGVITEHFPREVFSRELEGASLQMHDIRKALTMAKVDDRIRGIYLRLTWPIMGWAKAQEIRDVISDFKKSGKFVIAFMDFFNELSYYVALSADEIYLQPHSYVELNGFASELPFVKRMLEKIGVNAQVEHIGKYKNAADMYQQESMSPPHREAVEELLNDVLDEFVTSVSLQRNLEPDTLKSLLDKGIFDSQSVKALNVVDDLFYEPEVIVKLKEKMETDGNSQREPIFIDLSRYAEVPYAEVGLNRGSRFALIYAIGGIVSGSDSHDPWFGRNMGSYATVQYLRSARFDSGIEAVVIRVDSPGGSSIAADEIWAEIEEVRKVKPVIISMSDVAASGGYWISMDADAIVAHPLTITGSIGVWSNIFDLSGTYDKLGIDWETVKTGQSADMLTDKRPMRDEERQTFREMAQETYDVFVQKVADARDKSWQEIHELAQGRTWTGKRALNQGLVDSLGGLNLALAIAKKKAGLSPATRTRWRVYPQPKGFFESLIDQLNVRVSKLLFAKGHELNLIKKLPVDFKSLLWPLAHMPSVRKGEVMAIEPFVPEIH